MYIDPIRHKPFESIDPNQMFQHLILLRKHLFLLYLNQTILLPFAHIRQQPGYSGFVHILLLDYSKHMNLDP